VWWYSTPNDPHESMDDLIQIEERQLDYGSRAQALQLNHLRVQTRMRSALLQL
jgi:hypothetical protein